MCNNLTELVFILDRSGSMSGMESDTIGGFNSMIEKQKKIDEPCLVSTVLFNNMSEVIHDRVDLKEIKKMTCDDYIVGGCTALNDAIGQSIKHIERVHKYIRKEDVPAHTMFVITTDGFENASHKYSRKQVKDMIEAKKQLGWEFLFIGANIDAEETAIEYGIDKEFAANYVCDNIGTDLVFEGIARAASCLRMNKSTKAWNKNIQDDYNKRK